jgi:hypothetical protein
MSAKVQFLEGAHGLKAIVEACESEGERKRENTRGLNYQKKPTNSLIAKLTQTRKKDKQANDKTYAVELAYPGKAVGPIGRRHHRRRRCP